MILALAILGGILALALGIWLGLPGRSQPTAEEIEEAIERGGTGRRRLRKRSLSPVAWVQRKGTAEGPRARRIRGFRVEPPDQK